MAMASVSSKVEMVVGIVMNLLNRRAICSLEASPVPVILILIFFGAYSKMGGCDGYTLCPSEFQHRLDVLTVEL